MLRPPLPAMTPSAADAMLRELRRRGFARVSLRPDVRPWIRDALAAATSRDAAGMEGFRFPPVEEGRPIVYTESKRMAFRALFEVGTNCLAGLMRSLRENGGLEGRGREEESAAFRSISDALREVRGGDEGGSRFELFRRNENEPFEAGAPFSQSFFNLFNYDRGSLNGHVDRSLLTVIYSRTSQGTLQSQTSTQHRRSALWVKDRRGKWRDADRVVRPDQAIVVVGEDLEGTAASADGDGASIASSLGLFAAEHAVRVDPTGERIERSHFRRDPSCAEGVSNRTSAAMILRH